MTCTAQLIALYGYPGAGKDEIAKYLVERYGWVRVAFADPIRRMLVALDPAVGMFNNGKYVRLSDLLVGRDMEECKREFPEVRRLLQRLGTEAGRDVLGDDVWLDYAKRIIRGHLEDGRAVVVTDVRFPNEEQLMRRLGATLVEVRRKGHGPLGHVSELHYPTFQPNARIDNNGSVQDLWRDVDTVLSMTRFADTMSAIVGGR